MMNTTEYSDYLHHQLTGMAAQQQQGLNGQAYQQGFGLAQSLKRAIQQPAKEKTLFQEITTDVKSFIKEHRGIIYFVAVALIVDHFIFKGAFKARLQVMA